MKIRSVRYLAKEGIVNVWSHRLMSIASVGVLIACMLMMGIAVILTMNIDHVVDELEDQNVILAFFKDDVVGTSAEDLTQKIAGIDNVEKAVYISKQEGLNRQRKDAGDSYNELFDWVSEENPLPDSAQITISDINKFDTTIEKIKALDGVDSIRDQQEVTKTLALVRSVINNAGFWIILLLLVISLVIVSNTIKVTMFTRKLEINIMKAVGATNSFIRLPFIIEGILLGLIAGVFSTGIIYFLYKSAEKSFLSTFATQVVPFMSFAGYLLGGFILMGVLIGTVGSIISMGKYLRHEGSEFNAIA